MPLTIPKNIADLRAELGPVGVWLGSIAVQSAADAQAAAREIEALGYPTLWYGEANGKEAFAHAAILLAATEQLRIAAGIANIYARDPAAMIGGAIALGDAYPGRFVLGIGVSHEGMVTARGHDYSKPVTTMRAYLDGMDETLAALEPSRYAPPLPNPRVAVILAALRPNMLKLSAERSEGAHPYFVPVQHTARAREILGPDRILAPELMVILEEDADRARALARGTTQLYLGLPNYANNLRWLGYSEEDLADGGSDRLVDDIVAWGSVAEVQARVKAHLDAGADHVPIQPLAATFAEQLAQLRALAPVLLPGGR
jgi:probable F420-dependent oxidoreductase